MKNYFTRKKLFWLGIVFLALVQVLVVSALIPNQRRGSPRATCILGQRNLQQALRAHQKTESLKPGDPLNWSKIIGPGLFLETKPVCPLHGDYHLSPVIPEIGTLAALCQDPDHRPAGTEDW